jgi:hypothetical protein
VEDPALTKLQQAFATTDMFLILPLLMQAKASGPGKGDAAPLEGRHSGLQAVR